MNNLINQSIHIFANGKFNIRIAGEYSYVDHKLNGTWLDRIQRLNNINYTLIARPIEGMTDEEHRKYKKTFHSLNASELLEDRFLESEDTLLYLLSIGVYPFDQSHFEDGTVINTNEI